MPNRFNLNRYFKSLNSFVAREQYFPPYKDVHSFTVSG